jgi:hypothetical protein
VHHNTRRTSSDESLFWWRLEHVVQLHSRITKLLSARTVRTSGGALASCHVDQNRQPDGNPHAHNQNDRDHYVQHVDVIHLARRHLKHRPLIKSVRRQNGSRPCDRYNSSRCSPRDIRTRSQPCPCSVPSTSLARTAEPTRRGCPTRRNARICSCPRRDICKSPACSRTCLEVRTDLDSAGTRRCRLRTADPNNLKITFVLYRSTRVFDTDQFRCNYSRICLRRRYRCPRSDRDFHRWGPHNRRC